MKKIKISFTAILILLNAGVNIYSGDNGTNESTIRLKLKERSVSEKFQLTGSRVENLFSLEKSPLITKTIENSHSLNLNKDKKYRINPVKMTVLGVVGAGVFTGFHIYYANTWWKDQRDFFKFAADGYYARNMDKASHVYTANVFTVVSATAYEWAGMAPGKALLYGAITSLAYETYIEINDGFAPNWGFDWGDMGANVLGAVYPFLQEEIKPLKHINFKWSFKPGWLKKKTSSAQNDLLDDYTSMNFWLSVNPTIILPKSVTNKKFYPNFLAVAIGMSIKDASHTAGSQRAKVEWILSLDWDVNQLPGKSDFMVKLKKILNFYHFPAPAVKISPEGVWYGLYF